MVRIDRKITPIFAVVLSIAIMMLNGCALFRSKSSQPSVFDYLAIGDTYFDVGEYNQAIANYLSASELEPENPVIYYKIGLVYGAMHSLENPDQSAISGRADRHGRVEYREGSNHNNALYYFRKAADMGHLPSRDILRAMYDNIQHRDVQY